MTRDIPEEHENLLLSHALRLIYRTSKKHQDPPIPPHRRHSLHLAHSSGYLRSISSLCNWHNSTSCPRGVGPHGSNPSKTPRMAGFIAGRMGITDKSHNPLIEALNAVTTGSRVGLGTGKSSIRSWSSKWCSNESLISDSFSRPSGTQCTNQSFYWHGSFVLLAFHIELPRISVLHHLSTYIVGVSAYPTSTTVVIYIFVIYNVTSSLQEGWSGVKKKNPFSAPWSERRHIRFYRYVWSIVKDLSTFAF